MNKQTDEIIVQNQLTLMNDCYYCMQLNELCADCLEAKDARDAVIANQLVDDEIYTHAMMKLQDEPSAHDWISSETVVRVEEPTLSNWDRTQGEPIYTMRTEFFEQSSWLIDRIFNLDESMEMTNHECVCSVCHYTINKHAVCPNCN
jgi:hypothetical protein